MKHTSKNYVCTIKTDSLEYESKLSEIRKCVQMVNTLLRSDHECSVKWQPGYSDNLKQYRVSLRGRKPIKKHTFTNWMGKVSVRGFTKGGCIVGGLKNAGAVDVYIYRR